MAKVISAENVEGNFFGGLPFSVNWDFGGGTSASKLTINVVNEMGIYSNPKKSLGYDKLESIQIGDFNFNGYLVSYSLKESPTQGKTLELVYVDEFVDIDKHTIGLRGKWGLDEDNPPETLILVGKRYHPCDIDLDSEVEYQEEKGQYDSCDPCPQMPKLKYELACSPLLGEFNIFETYYTFNELISVIPFSTNFQGEGSNQYKTFKSTHIGPLTSVLSSWCSDLGLAYFWDPFAQELTFISRSSALSVADPGDSDDIIDKESGATVENTYSRGVVGYLGLQGGIKDYSCVKSTVENLACLKLGDLSADGTYDSFSEPRDGDTPSDADAPNQEAKYKDYEAKEIAVALSYYSKDMRDAFLWFDNYGIYGPEDLKAMAGEGDEGDGASADQIKDVTPLLFFGNMRILTVYAYGEDGDVSSAGFAKINGSLSAGQRSTFNLPLGEGGESGSPDDPNYYFFVAQVNEELYRKELESESRLARDFLGKYWYSQFETTIPNATNRTTEVSVDGPDGSGAWYYKGSQLKNLAIFNFGHQEGSFIDGLDKELAGDDEEYLDKINKYIDDPKEKEFSIKSFVLLERESKWEPTSEKSQWYNTLFDWYASQLPLKLDSDGRPDVLFSVYPDALNDPSIKLYVARKGNSEAFQIRKTKSTKHPQESSSQKSFTESYQSALGEFEVVEICKWGISENSDHILLDMGNGAIKIHTPVESFHEVQSGTIRQDNNKLLYDVRGEGSSATLIVPASSDVGYDAVVKSSSKFKAFLPKYEDTYIKEPQNWQQASNVSYLYAQVNEENINYWLRKGNGLSSDSNRKDCWPENKGPKFKQYMDTIHEFTSYSMTSPQSKYSFKMAGLFPVVYGVRDGLSSVSINITDDGVFTNYVLEDKIIQPPSINVIEQFLKNNAVPQRTIGDGRLPIDPWKLRKMMKSVVNVE
jgi:hypothetical protein